MLTSVIATVTTWGTSVSFAQVKQDIDIPAQSLAAAITELAEETGIKVSAPSALLAGKTANSVSGFMTPQEALGRILAGTDIELRELAESRIVLGQTVPSGAFTDDGDVLLDPVTLTTARRIAEDVTNVPASVSVVTEQEIERSNVTDLIDYVERVPNLSFQEGGNPIDNDVSIRGISNFTGDASSGPVVGFFIDDVSLNPTGATSTINPNLIDVEQVEVLFGPQGTTFGRSTIAGAVNLITKKPSEEREAILEFQGGSFPDGRVKGTLGGSLTGDELLTARLTAFGEVDRGFIELPLQDDFNGENNFGARLALRSKPTDRLTLDLSGSFDRTVFDQNSTVDPSTFFDDQPQSFETTDGQQTLNRSLVIFDGAYDFDIGKLSSKTSLSRSSADQLSGILAVPTEVISSILTDTQSIAQEFKFDADGIQVPLLGEVGFVAGVNFAFSDEDVATDIDFGFSALVADTTESVNDLGIFGDLRFRPIERLELGVGARFSRASVTFEGEQEDAVFILPPPIGTVVVPGFPFESFSETFTAITPRGSAKYDWTDDFSTYVSISTGFRPGGFNVLGPAFGLGFDEERVINYEGGFRKSVFDDRLNLRGSGFALFYDDIQITSVIAPGSVAITNAGAARSIGTEFNINAQPIQGLKVDLSYGLSLTEFTDFDDAVVGGAETDLTGERLPNAPVHTFRITVEYEHSVKKLDADAFFRVEHSYTSEGIDVTSLTPEISGTDARNIVNLRSGLRGETWDVEAFVENLFDERFSVGSDATAIGLSLFELGETRRFGVRGRVRF
ncbi:MAG: TonB-dependent receptor [Pseudomonadota bacterium]